MSDAWSFGWVAVSALATLVLGGATVYLAFTTRKLATATVDDLRAQWRPALIPSQQVPGQSPPIIFETQTARLLVRVRNGGRGPAAFIRVHLDPLGMSPSDWGRAALAEREEAVLAFGPLPTLPPAMQLLMDYRDLAGRTYASSLVISVVTDQHGNRQLSFYDVRLYRDTTLTPLGDSTAQPALKALPQQNEG